MGYPEEIENFMKALLKAVFPIVFLKKLFVHYNRLKIKVIDKLIYRSHELGGEAFLDNQSKNPFLIAGLNISEFSVEIQTKLILWNDPAWRQDQYLLSFEEAGYIEPKVGWGMNINDELIYPSLGFASAPHVRKPNFFEYHFNKKRVIELGKVISLRDTGEENYFHFFNDVLPKLFYLIDNGYSLDEYKIIISTQLNRKQYFQYFKNNTHLSKLNWYVQNDEWIKFEKAIFCKPFTHTKKYFDQASVLLKLDRVEFGDRRIFLTRSAKSLRYIDNLTEIESIFNAYDFEIIDTADMNFIDQVSLFRGCRYLVAVHGAGITNIIFRDGKPLSLLEIIHPGPYIPFHYILLSKIFNFSYHIILGTKSKNHLRGGFSIDVVQLEKELKEMLTDANR